MRLTPSACLHAYRIYCQASITVTTDVYVTLLFQTPAIRGATMSPAIAIRSGIATKGCLLMDARSVYRRLRRRIVCYLLLAACGVRVESATRDLFSYARNAAFMLYITGWHVCLPTSESHHTIRRKARALLTPHFIFARLVASAF